MTINEIDTVLAGLIRRSLSMRFVVRSRNMKLFMSMLKYKKQLGEHFATLGVRFILDENLGVAYLQEKEDLSDQIEYRLGRKVRLEPLETLLVIILRQKRQDYLTTMEADRESPLISREEIRHSINDFSSEKIDQNFEGKFRQALDRLIKFRILLTVDEELQYEISPVCDIILPADHIHSYLKQAREYFRSRGFRKKSDSGLEGMSERPEPDQDDEFGEI